MKKFFTLIASTVFFIQAHAQLISNFETWHTYQPKIFGLGIPTTPTCEINDGWFGIDSTIISFGRIIKFTGTYNKQIFKVAGHSGSFALEARTTFQDSLINNIGNGPTPASASNVPFLGDTSIKVNGTPIGFTNPVAVEFWAKTNIIGGDSTSLIAILIDDSDGGDSTVATAEVYIDTTVAGWTRFQMPFTYVSGLTPTKVQLYINSGNLNLDTTNTTANLPHIGTTIAVDDISILGPLGNTQVILSSGLINMQPNPASKNVTVNLNSTGNYMLNIYNLAGGLVVNQIISASTNNIDISNLVSGVYVVKVRDSNNKYTIQTEKLIVK